MSTPVRERCYVGGPYSDPDPAVREANVRCAVEAAAEVMRRGHYAHCPHAATHPIALVAPEITYDTWLGLDLGIIDHWATAFLYLKPSPGTDRELRNAQRHGLRIFRSLDEVPDLREAARRGAA